jgi:hypothetical protein
MTSFPAHTAVRRVVFASVMALALLVLITPRANAQLGGLGDAVGGTIDNVTGNDGSNSSSSDDGSTEGSEGGLLDPIGNVVDETVTNTVEVVKDTGDKTVDKVQDVANHAGQTVTNITDSAEETVKNVIKKPRDSRDRSPNKGRDRSTSSPRADRAGSDVKVFGSSLADSMQRDAKNPVLVSSSSDAPTVAASDSLVEQIARGALAAAQQAAFPLLLTMLVAGFLMVQNRIDRSDPKLALAPVDSDHDLLSFT